jgi:hypothetical protein
MRYRKKPVVIEARQFLSVPACEADIVDWAASSGVTIEVEHDGGELTQLRIPTLEGDHIATHEDFIIKGIKGEFYPCKPDIFEATYESVEE